MDIMKTNSLGNCSVMTNNSLAISIVDCLIHVACMKMKSCHQCDAVRPGFYMEYFLNDTASIELGEPELKYPLFFRQRYRKGSSPHGIERGHEQAVHIDKSGVKQRGATEQSSPHKKAYATETSFEEFTQVLARMLKNLPS